MSMRVRLLVAASVFLVAILIPMVIFMNRGPNKVFHLSKEQIRPLATNRGGCLATDMIVVEGKKIGFM